MFLTGLSYLAAADPTAMAVQAQAECLQALEQGDGISTAARAGILAAFTAGHGYSADADYSPTSWLIHCTRITKGAARAHLGWARRATAHPQVVATLAEGTVLTESMARTICRWTDKLPADCRQTADDILIAAALAGARKEDLAALAAEIYARSLPEDDDNPEPGLRGPAGAGGDHVRRGRRHRRGLDAAVRGGRDRSPGRPVGSDGSGGHPEPGAALP